MKKTTILALSAIVLAALAGCGSKKDAQAHPGVAHATGEPPKH